MYYIVETNKGFEQAAADLEAAVKNHGFGVMHIHDLATTFLRKGVAFPEEARIFEICNPQQASKLLAGDMRLNMALPCRISVYTQKDHTYIGLIKPAQMLAALSQDPALMEIARQVEAVTMQMVDEAR